MVAEDEWLCDACLLSAGDDFGFEEGPEHTAHSFQRRADAFRQMWLSTHAPKPFKSKSRPNTPAKLAKKPALLKSEPAYAFASADVGVASTSTVPASTIDNKPIIAPLDGGPTWEEKMHLEDHLEREFWRLAESQTETVEVEYGADLHVRKYGRCAAGNARDRLTPAAASRPLSSSRPIRTLAMVGISTTCRPRQARSSATCSPTSAA